MAVTPPFNSSVWVPSSTKRKPQEPPCSNIQPNKGLKTVPAADASTGVSQRGRVRKKPERFVPGIAPRDLPDQGPAVHTSKKPERFVPGTAPREAPDQGVHTSKKLKPAAAAPTRGPILRRTESPTTPTDAAPSASNRRDVPIAQLAVVQAVGPTIGQVPVPGRTLQDNLSDLRLLADFARSLYPPGTLRSFMKLFFYSFFYKLLVMIFRSLLLQLRRVGVLIK